MIDSWDLHLRAEKKSAETICTYLEAARWFAAGYLIPAIYPAAGTLASPGRARGARTATAAARAE